MSDRSDRETSHPLSKGACIGLLGGGQLGMFFVQSAQKLGYRVCCFTQYEKDPAAQIADETVIGDFRDSECLQTFCDAVDVVTYEFENIPTETLRTVNASRPLFPQFDLIFATQNRAREKAMLRELDIPTAQFHVVQSHQELVEAVADISVESILKTASDGYDGKGQWAIDGDTDLDDVWQQTGGAACTLEAKIDLAAEYSMLVAGDQLGGRAFVGPMCNHHVNHILDLSYVDAALSADDVDRMKTIASKIADHFGLIGLICIEYFADRSGNILVNEIAPRPHNSGHLTIDTFSQSQFDLQATSVSGHAVSQPKQESAAAMVNLLGDLWQADSGAAIHQYQLDSPLAERIGDPPVHLHLYGKSVPKSGRKMGHATALAGTTEEAISAAKEFRIAIVRSSAGSLRGSAS